MTNFITHLNTIQVGDSKLRRIQLNKFKFLINKITTTILSNKSLNKENLVKRISSN